MADSVLLESGYKFREFYLQRSPPGCRDRDLKARWGLGAELFPALLACIARDRSDSFHVYIIHSALCVSAICQAVDFHKPSQDLEETLRTSQALFLFELNN